MKLRIAIWASAGFLVGRSGHFLPSRPSQFYERTNEGCLDSDQLNLPRFDSCMHYPISLYEVLAANAVTYGLVGELIVETLRHQLHHAQ